MTNNEFDSAIKGKIKEQVNETVFEIWIRPLTLDLTEGVLTVSSPSAFILKVVENEFRPLFEAAVHETVSDAVTVQFVSSNRE